MENESRNNVRGEAQIESTTWIVIWLVVLTVLAVFQSLTSRYGRRLWYNCITCKLDCSCECQDEEEYEIEQFIINSLTPFTKVIDKNDFQYDDLPDDVEKGDEIVSLDDKNTIYCWYTDDETSKDISFQSQSSDMKSTITSEELNSTADDLISDNAIHLSINQSQFESFSDEESNTNHYSTSSNTLKHTLSPSKRNDNTRTPTRLQLPAPSVSFKSYLQVNSSHLKCTPETKTKRQDLVTRCVNMECSICLSLYIAGDKVSWSGLADCSHAFHQSCIVEWLRTLGKKASENNGTSQNNACKFKMVCPVCRQVFIEGEDKE